MRFKLFLTFTFILVFSNLYRKLCQQIHKLNLTACVYFYIQRAQYKFSAALRDSDHNWLLSNNLSSSLVYHYAFMFIKFLHTLHVDCKRRLLIGAHSLLGYVVAPESCFPFCSKLAILSLILGELISVFIPLLVFQPTSPTSIQKKATH